MLALVFVILHTGVVPAEIFFTQNVTLPDLLVDSFCSIISSRSTFSFNITSGVSRIFDLGQNQIESAQRSRNSLCLSVFPLVLVFQFYTF